MLLISYFYFTRNIMTSKIKMIKLSLREIKQLAQSYTTSQVGVAGSKLTNSKNNAFF
jgi:hypothetical protein